MTQVVGTLVLAIHIVAGTVCVLAGMPALLTPKGGRSHRLAGAVFRSALQVVIGSAVVLTALMPDPYFAGLTASAALAAFSGLRVLGRKRPDLRSGDRARTLDWVVTLLVLAVSIMLILLAATGRIIENVPVVLALGAGTMTYALYDVWRFLKPTAFPFTPQLWFYEHLVKMIGAYFAAVAAFSGSVLHFLPAPWKQLWATSLGQALAVTLIIYYSRRFRRGTGRPADSPRGAKLSTAEPFGRRAPQGL